MTLFILTYNINAFIISYSYRIICILMTYNILKRGDSMINEENFAERLSYLRELKNVSAREMSLSIGQNESYINRIENKKAFPSMQCFFYICDYLHISPKDFFDDNIQTPESMDKLTTTLKKLSPKQIELIKQLVNELSKK